MAKYPQWEYDLLRYLGTPAPLTNEGMDSQFPNSLLALNLWAQSEGNVTNNPLATSGRGAGASNCVAQCGSSSPIYEYDNEADGVAQMGHFLQGSFYSQIVKALVGNADLTTIYSAINSSPWCKGCQNGQYPVDLATVVHGGSGGISGTVGVGSGGAAGSGGSLTGITPGKAPPNTPGNDLSTCVIQFPGFLFFSGPCILTKGGVKWMSGVAALAAGALIGSFGVIALAAWGFQASGAKQTVSKVAGSLPTPMGRIVKASGGGAGGNARSSSRRSSASRSSAGSSGPATAGRRESRQIERRYEAASREQPIGPRGGVPGQAARAARKGASVPGARRRQPTERRRAVNTSPNTVDRNGVPF